MVEHEHEHFVIEKSEKYDQPCSAKNKVANVYTDSVYARGVCHLFGALLKQRGFKKTEGTPIQHLKQITDLISATMQPTKLVIIKCQVHRQGNDNIIKGLEGKLWRKKQF